MSYLILIVYKLLQILTEMKTQFYFYLSDATYHGQLCFSVGVVTDCLIL